ncbi:MAG TPA: YgjP-like metallopeptidase domain-containing protein [Rhodocyclaceae bacterium]|jgi:hypothetical protein
MKPRNPQLSLRLDLGPGADTEEAWVEGAPLAFLGSNLSLTLDTAHKQATLDGAVLHLPLPPEATPRQIQDAAEAWLRNEAKNLLAEAIHRHSARQCRTPPKLALSFAARSHWVHMEADCLRCNWRLVEQPMEVIDQVIGRAIATLPLPVVEGDLFAAVA